MWSDAEQWCSVLSFAAVSAIVVAEATGKFESIVGRGDARGARVAVWVASALSVALMSAVVFTGGQILLGSTRADWLILMHALWAGACGLWLRAVHTR